MEAKFPHCDSRVLHAPGKCVFCDEYPDKQTERENKNIAFTGEDFWPQDGVKFRPKSQCPAEEARSLEVINAWSGNRAITQGQLDVQSEQVRDLMSKYEKKGSKP